MSYLNTAKTHIFQSKHSVVRQVRMDNNQENKILLENLHSTLAPKNSPRRIKDTSMLQVLRLVQEDLYREPQIAARSSNGENEIISHTVDSTVSQIKTLGGYGKAVRKALTESTRREGTSFVMAVPAYIQNKRMKGKPYYDKLEYRYLSNGAVYFSPSVSNIEDSEWVAVRYEYGYEEAKKQLRCLYEFKGKLEPGDPIPINNKQETEENDKDLLPDRTAIYEYWNKIEGVRLVIAGSNCRVIQELTGDDYPYLDEFGQEDIPIAQLNATGFEYGGYALSFLDVMKDITEQKRRQFNQILPYFDRVSNQLLAITGVTPLEDIASQIQEAEEYQLQGMVPFLSLSDPQARITPVFPSDLTAPMERMRNVFIEELSDRLGLNLRAQQQQSGSAVPTATQVVDQRTVHAKSIANINILNKPFYSRIHQVTINYARRLWDEDDERIVPVNQGSESEYMLPLGQAIKATDGWSGEFIVDTTVELDLTRNEEVIVIQEIKQSFLKDMQIQAFSPAEVKPLIDTMKAHIKLVGMDKYYQDAEVDAFYDAIIQKSIMIQQQAEAEEQAKQQQQQGGGEGEMFEGRKGATRSTPQPQRQAAKQGANAPQPV